MVLLLLKLFYTFFKIGLFGSVPTIKFFLSGEREA